MRDKTDKRFGFVFTFFVGLFLLGVATGGLFSEKEAVRSLGSLVSEKVPLQIGDWKGLFSVLFFEEAFYLLTVFLFGVTYLGVLIAPCVVFLKGAVYGINFTVLFRSQDVSEYVKHCFLSLPSILGVVVLVIFAVHAFYISLLLCRQLCHPSSSVQSIKKYGLHFIFIFVFEALISGVYLLITVIAGNLF